MSAVTDGELDHQLFPIGARGGIIALNHSDRVLARLQVIGMPEVVVGRVLNDVSVNLSSLFVIEVNVCPSAAL